VIEECRNLFQTLCLIFECTQTVLEYNALQIIDAVNEFFLLIFFKEELGIIETGAQDPFVTVLDCFQMIIVTVERGS
jgi:hypothetical protein